MMNCTKSNIFVELPVTMRRILYTSVSAVWYCVQLVSVFLLGFCLFCLGKRTEKKEELFHRYIFSLYRYDMRVIPGIQFRIRNSVRETFDKGCVIISNHQSFLDSVCMILLNPKILIVTNDHVWNNRIIHHILSFANYYPISRGLDNGLAFFRERIKAGYSIVIFPEGERSRDCSILRFHRGAFYIAEQLQCDILPVFIHGVGHVMPKGSALLNRGEILIDIRERIPFGSTTWGIGYSERTKKARHYYSEYDRLLCKEIEDAAYYAHTVVELYRRISYTVSRRLKRLLAENVNFSYLVDVEYKESVIFVPDDEYGVVGLLLSLVHPDRTVYTADNWGMLHRLKRKCYLLPVNLRVGEKPIETVPHDIVRK